MDNIILKKIWQEADLIEIEVSIDSEFVVAKNNYYVSTNSILDCQRIIFDFINKKSKECNLEFGKIGEGNVPCFNLNLFQDRTGHVLIDVFFELDDGSMPKHQCSCYIKTEIGLLDKFASKIRFLADLSLGTRISLLPEN